MNQGQPKEGYSADAEEVVMPTPGEFARNREIANRLGEPLGGRWVRPPGQTLTVGLVACTAKKKPFPTAAKDLYISDLFNKARRWAEVFCDEWGILSAEHKLVLPDQVLEPYDQQLGGVADEHPRTKLSWENQAEYDKTVEHFYRVTAPRIIARKRDVMHQWWSSEVAFQCFMQWGEDTHYVLLAGAGYRAPWEKYNVRGLAWSTPFKGLGIGQQKGWLKRQLQGVPDKEQDLNRPLRRRLRLN